MGDCRREETEDGGVEEAVEDSEGEGDDDNDDDDDKEADVADEDEDEDGLGGDGGRSVDAAVVGRTDIIGRQILGAMRAQPGTESTGIYVDE